MANLTASFAPSKTINEAVIENAHGAQVAFNSNGSCVNHPDILLRQKTFTGWKILEKECPRCKIEWEDRRCIPAQHPGARNQPMSGYYSNQPSQPQVQISVQHNPPQYGNHPTQYGNQPPQYGNQPPRYGNQPPQYGNQPPQYGNQPHRNQPPPYMPQAPQPPRHYAPPQPTSSPLPPSPGGPAPVQFAKIVGVRNAVAAPFTGYSQQPPLPPARSSSQPTSTVPSSRMESASLRHSDPSNSFSMSNMSSSLASVAHDEKDAKQQLNQAYKSDDVKGILAIMRKHADSSSIQGVGCKALWRLGHRYGKAEAVLSHGGREIVKDAVTEHSRVDDDIAGHGPMLLKMLDQMLSPPVARSAVSAPAPLSSLPPVDSRVEKIAVEDIEYLATHNALDKLLAIMSWFPRSAKIQGAGCKELFALVTQLPEGSVTLEEHDEHTIKDAVHRFSSMDDDVADYGPMLLTICTSSLEIGSGSERSSSRNRPPLSSFPAVDHLVERITLKSIDEESEVSRVLALMQKYMSSANIAGHGCKQLWNLVCHDDAMLADIYHGKDLIKDAIYYHGHVQGLVTDYGTMILDRLVEYRS